jgi:hypothetical protein
MSVKPDLSHDFNGLERGQGEELIDTPCHWDEGLIETGTLETGSSKPIQNSIASCTSCAKYQGRVAVSGSFQGQGYPGVLWSSRIF